ncbi:MAG: hypothetical protein IH586_07450 [Anaerolineaceae bacterium]|nr:hypothetical protein [Anaerolineaceae bacterium]
MATRLHKPTRLISLLLALALSSVSCTQTVVTTSPTAAVQPLSPSSTSLPPTQTPPPLPSPTPTLPPTASATFNPSPSITHTPVPTLGLVENGLSAWCLPEHGIFATDFDPAHPPADARIADWTGSTLEVRNLPSNGCVFVYTFNQPAPAGLTLEISDSSGSKPFLTANLVPSANPDAVYAVLHHTMIIAPPFWNVGFTIALKNGTGAELRHDQVNLHRWVPKLCWNGQPPNVFTLRCPLAQDLHPWDPSYGTPMPTSPPK